VIHYRVSTVLCGTERPNSKVSRLELKDFRLDSKVYRLDSKNYRLHCKVARPHCVECWLRV